MEGCSAALSCDQKAAAFVVRLGQLFCAGRRSLCVCERVRADAG